MERHVRSQNGLTLLASRSACAPEASTARQEQDGLQPNTRALRRGGRRAEWVTHLKSLTAIWLFATACAGQDEPRVGGVCQQIVGGHPDEDWTAVVSLESAWGEQLCSGSLVGTKAGRPLVLTSAHCLDVPIARAVFGQDRHAPTFATPIADVATHPAFERATGLYDFALLVLDEAPPGVAPLSLPSSASDDLMTNDEIEIVGYGDTETTADNPLRNAVAAQISKLEPLQFTYEQELGGPCDGDSGGPALALVRGRKTVVGVTSFGAGGCRSRGTSARVAAALKFLETSIDKTPCRGDIEQ